MKLLTVFLLFLASMASMVSGEAKRRKHYTSSSYLDSYQFPDQPRNGYIEEPEESSGESYSDFMDRYYGSSYGGAPNYQIPSLGGGSRFDYQPEGSGDQFNDNEEGSGLGFREDDDEDNPRNRNPSYIPYTPGPVNPNTFSKPTTTSTSTTSTTTTYFIPPEIFEGSGEGSGECSGYTDDEDCEGEVSGPIPTIPPINIPTTNIIPMTTTDDDIIIEDSTTIKISTTTVKTTLRTTTTTESTTKSTTSTTTTTTTTEKIYTKRPSSTKTTKSTPRITTTVLPPNMETTTPRIYGKNPEKVPTVLFGNRILVICLYSAVVFCITLSILVALCMLIRCRKQAPSEVSSDTASSDLPIIKADAKRYNAQIRRISDSPPPLPDLKLFDEAPKNSDFNRSRSGGSLRKSKRDLKPPVNPNWL